MPLLVKSADLSANSGALGWSQGSTLRASPLRQEAQIVTSSRVPGNTPVLPAGCHNSLSPEGVRQQSWELVLCRVCSAQRKGWGKLQHCKKGMKLLRVRWGARSVPQLLGKSHLLAAMTCEMDFPALCQELAAACLSLLVTQDHCQGIWAP